MSTTVEIPATIQSALKVPPTVTVREGSIREILNELFSAWPTLKPRLQAESGELHRFVNIYVGTSDIRQLEGLETRPTPGEVVTILSAVSGG